MAVPLQFPYASVDCLETPAICSHQGFSKVAAWQLSLSRCESTCVSCQCKWKVYMSWRRGSSHSSPRLLSLSWLTSSFFGAVWRGFRFQLSRVTILCGVVSLRLFFPRYPLLGCIISLDLRKMSLLLRLFVLRIWDLEVVIRVLCGEDYEPMANLSLWALTKKTQPPPPPPQWPLQLGSVWVMCMLSSQVSFRGNDVIHCYLRVMGQDWDGNFTQVTEPHLEGILPKSLNHIYITSCATQA